jgi:hypothetical protein
VIPHLVDGGLSILQYANDTILFIEHDLEKARNLKLILAAFEQLSGLKINFHKSELFCFGDAQETATSYAELFGCGQGQFPIRYLGIPIHYRRLTIIKWKAVQERLQKRLSRREDLVFTWVRTHPCIIIGCFLAPLNSLGD